MIRKIIHIDMDAFYASVEQRDFPEYRNKPLAVGYGDDRGVVAAASYEARAYGVRSAMSSRMAVKRCPHLIFAQPRFEVYREVSGQIMDIFFDYTELVEPLSIDEAFLDVTDNHNIRSATIIAKEIKRRILEKTGLTASAGVSVNKFLAKIASDVRKPDGFFSVLPEEAERFVESLKIEQFYGVGKVTARKMHRLGIHTGADLKRFDRNRLVSHFGKAGNIYYDNSRAIDNREVIPNQMRKSVGGEETFDFDMDMSAELILELYRISCRVWKRIEDEDFFGKTITLKVKFHDFEVITRSRTQAFPVRQFLMFWETGREILSLVDTKQKKIRLLGITLSHSEKDFAIQPRYIQLELKFDD